MKIAFITNKSPHGVDLLESLRKNNIKIYSIIIERISKVGYLKKLRKILNREGIISTIKKILAIIYKRFEKSDSGYLRSSDYYKKYTSKVYMVKDVNGGECEQILRAIAPSLIILGGSRIIKKNILDIPKIGTLNAHPGLLPKYRGVDVIRWAIYNGDDVGVTIHLVDEGVDTGEIIEKQIIHVNSDDDIDSLKERASKLAGELMTKTVIELVARNGRILTKPQHSDEGKLYFPMNRNQRKQVMKKLNERKKNKI